MELAASIPQSYKSQRLITPAIQRRRSAHRMLTFTLGNATNEES